MTATNPRRADAARNHGTLLEVATRAFASGGEPSMRAIARDAGVGVATLYRHFPTRQSLVEAIYREHVRRLVAGAEELLAGHPPAVAMRRWMDLFADWVATKHGMLQALHAMADADPRTVSDSRDQLLAAVRTILDAGRAAGDLRPDVEAADVADAVIGMLTVAAARGPDAPAGRLLDLLLDGLRPRLPAAGG